MSKINYKVIKFLINKMLLIFIIHMCVASFKIRPYCQESYFASHFILLFHQFLKIAD